MKVIKGKRKIPRRIMLMGTNHVGKSTLANQAHGVFFIDTDAGLDDIDCERTPTITDASQLFDALLWAGQQDSYQTIAIDSIDMVEKLIQDQVVQDKGAKSFGDPCFDYGRGRKLCDPYWTRFRKALRWLQSEKRMNIILLTHVEAVEVKPPNEASFHRYEPPLDKEIRDALCDWCTEVFFLDFRTMTRSTDSGFNRTRNIAVNGSMDRYIRTTPTTGIRAKNRIGLPEEIPFNDPIEAWKTIQLHIDASSNLLENETGNIDGVVVDGSSKASYDSDLESQAKDTF